MTIERLSWLRDEFSDEVPSEVIHGGGQFKVRRAWWQCLVGNLENALRENIIPEEAREDTVAFLEYTISEFRQQTLTKPEDIQRGNNLLDRILGRSDFRQLSLKFV